MRIANFTDGGNPAHLVYLNRREALRLVISLSQQLIGGNPNTDRLELVSDDGEYLSLAVAETEDAFLKDVLKQASDYLAQADPDPQRKSMLLADIDAAMAKHGI